VGNYQYITSSSGSADISSRTLSDQEQVFYECINKAVCRRRLCRACMKHDHLRSSMHGGAGSNFEQGSDKEKRADFSKLGLTGYSGDKVISQRDIQRLVKLFPHICSHLLLGRREVRFRRGISTEWQLLRCPVSCQGPCTSSAFQVSSCHQMLLPFLLCDSPSQCPLKYAAHIIMTLHLLQVEPLPVQAWDVVWNLHRT